MNELSLFSGAGGGLLASRLLGWRTIGYVEWDDYCQRVIAARIADGYLDAAPIFTDVREFVQSGCADEYRGIADVVSGGFPCQPFSVAGKRAGADDHRNMWPATLSVIQRVRPQYVFLENVPGLLAARSYRCVCGWPDRWGGSHRDSGIEEEVQSLLRGGDYRHGREGQADTRSNETRAWRDDDAGASTNGEMGSVPEMAYRWGRSHSLPAEGIAVPDVESERRGGGIEDGGTDRVSFDISEWDSDMDGWGAGDGEDIEGGDTPLESEGAGCPICGRRLVQTDANSVWYFGKILGDLAESGYDARWRVLSAAEVGAPHRRDRLWILAYRDGSGRSAEPRQQQAQWSAVTDSGSTRDVADATSVRCFRCDPFGRGGSKVDGWTSGRGAERWCPQEPARGSSASALADADGGRCEQCDAHERAVSEFDAGGDAAHSNGAGCKEQQRAESGGEFLAASELTGWWQVEPAVGRVVDGLAYRVDRLRTLGNGQVALCAALAFLLLAGGES